MESVQQIALKALQAIRDQGSLVDLELDDVHFKVAQHKELVGHWTAIDGTDSLFKIVALLGEEVNDIKYTM